MEVVFDFDGVLADTIELLFTTSNEIFGPVERKEFQEFFTGNSLTNGVQTYGEDTLRRFFVRWEEVLRDVTLNDGGRDIIAWLSERKVPMHIVTSNTRKNVVRCLKNTQIDPAVFSFIFGKEDHFCKKEKIKQIYTQRKVMLQDVLFVTDSLGDIKEGVAAGVRTVGVTWGVHSADMLAQGAPTHIVTSWEALRAVMQ